MFVCTVFLRPFFCLNKAPFFPLFWCRTKYILGSNPNQIVCAYYNRDLNISVPLASVISPNFLIISSVSITTAQTDQAQTNCKGLLGNIVQLFLLTCYAFARSASEVRLGQAVVVVAILHVSCLFHGWGVWILCCLLTGFIPFEGQKTQTQRRERKKQSYTGLRCHIHFYSVLMQQQYKCVYIRTSYFARSSLCMHALLTYLWKRIHAVSSMCLWVRVL